MDGRRGGARLGRQVVVGKRDAARAGAGRHPGRRPRAARGPARPGQDADRPVASPRPSGWTSAACSSPPTCCPPTSPARSCTTSARPTSRSGPARSSPTCCSPTRSTGRRRRPSRRCSRRCRRSRSRSRAPRTRCPPFHVLATANPIEYEGTYPLPEAQLDRFLLRVVVRLPDRGRGVGGAAPADGPPPGGDRARPGASTPTRCCGRMQAPSRTSTVEDSVGRYMRDADRRHPRPRPRCWSAPRRAARWRCCCSPGRSRCCAGRDYVVPEDVKAVAVAGAGAPDHAAPEMWLRRVDPQDVVREVLGEVPAPPTAVRTAVSAR